MNEDEKKEAKLAEVSAPLRLGVSQGNSLHQRIANAPKVREAAQAQAASIPKFINFSKIFILPDCSGSMHGTSLDMLKTACDGYLTNCNPAINAVGVASFPEQAYNSPTSDYNLIRTIIQDLDADGGTPLADAMGYLIENEQFTHAVIISDGQANNLREAEICAQQFKEKKITCDCVHIGASQDGEALLKHIAEITGGAYIKFTDVSQFAKAFSYLSPAKRAQLTAHKNPIALLGCNEVKL